MKTNARMVLRMVAIVVVLGVAGWQWWNAKYRAPSAARKPEATTAAPSPASSAQPAKPVKPAPPEKRVIGKLTLTACKLKPPHSSAGVAAFCTKFPVPENRLDPKSRTIELKLAIVPSDSQVSEKDMVVYLAGGPGQSATETYPQLDAAFAPLRKHHDIVVLDQRGTGGSHPLSCPEVEKANEGQADLPFVPARAKDLVGQCLREVEKTSDPRYYTTTIAVADLEAVRQALGAPKFDLVGISYGTRMAQQFAAAHPAAVRSIVLDSVAPNALVLGETFASDLARALKLQADACIETPACRKAFGNWRKTLLDLHTRLAANPVKDVAFRDPRTSQPATRTVTGDTLAELVHLFAYNAEASALLPLTVEQAVKGNFAPLLGQSQLGRGDLSGNMDAGMQLSVMCTEDAPFLKPRPQDADTLLGTRPIERIQALCSVWPHGAMPEDFHQPFRSSIPTLILSGERDPVTPPRFAQEVLKGLSNGRVLSLKGMGHGELTIGCMPKVVQQFIQDPDPGKLDATCLDRISPIPAFVNFNGASP